MTLHMIVGAASDTGRVRDHNEDSYLVDDQLALVAVADGMGGHQAGEVASATALEALRASVSSGDAIRDAVAAANGAVYEKSTTDERLRGMGTTMTAATLASGGTLLLGHVGDSRAYLLRDGELHRVTTDHSLVEELVQAGELTEEEAEADPRRSMITRALGIEPVVNVDLYPLQLQPGDRLLFCSDGLTGMVPEDHIAGVLEDEVDPNVVAQQLVALANDAGGIDNITAVVVDLVDDADMTASLPAVAPDTPPPDEPEPEPEPEAAATEPAAPRRRRWWRVLRWAIPIVLVIGIAGGVLWWYARDTYYVGNNHGQVAVFKGRPGGVLIWKETLARREQLRVSDLQPTDQEQVKAGHGQFSSLADAEAYVRRIRRSATTTTTTTTTAPPPITTTTAPPTPSSTPTP